MAFGRVLYNPSHSRAQKTTFEVRVRALLAASLIPLPSLAAEQRIAPWQEDAVVSKCPLCTYVHPPFTLSHLTRHQRVFPPANESETPLPSLRANYLLPPHQTSSTPRTVLDIVHRRFENAENRGGGRGGRLRRKEKGNRSRRGKGQQ